jgi:hypothetical protein
VSAGKTKAYGVFGLVLSLALYALASVDGTAAQQPAAAPGSSLYEGALLIPGDGSAPVANAAFLVQDGAIVRIGRRGEVAAPRVSCASTCPAGR